MQKILRKRILRDLRENLSRYLALGLMIILGMYIVISLVAAADTVMLGSAAAAQEQSVEDGQFGLFMPLSDTEKETLTKAGIIVEEHFYLDYEAGDGSILRVSQIRREIDRAQADAGRLPQKDGEIFLEKRYCEEQGISVGDEIQAGGHSFLVCGIGTTPDYDAPYRNLSDNVADSSQFGTAFVRDADYERLKREGGSLQSEEYVYAYLLNGRLTDRELKELLQGLVSDSGLPALTRFLPAKDNIRIGGAADDVVINKATGLFAGVLVLLLLSYVVSVYAVHTIERESEAIGTLYALGVKRKELLCHYLFLPAALALTAGIIGTVMGYSSLGVKGQMRETYSYFSLPDFSVAYQPYLFFYGIFMPPAAAVLTNLPVIYGKLKKPALALIRREQKGAKVKAADLGEADFLHAFRIRHFLREKRTAFTVFLGMFLALLVCMIGLDCYALCRHVKTDSVADTRYEYLYTYKYPEETASEGGEAAYGVTLKKEAMGYNFDVLLLGISPENPYFDAPVERGQSRVLVSSAMADKYGLKAGDDLILNDEDKEKRYAFTVDGIVPYSAGMTAFMDIGSLRELMGVKEDYYNMVFASRALEIDSGRLCATASKAAVEKSAAVFTEKMWPMIRMVTLVSALVFLVVMYLMLKVMIDRCASSVAMMKIFGYRKNEIRRLYLDGNFVVVAASAAVGIPLSKAIVDAVYPYLTANVAVGLNLAFSWRMYAGLYGAILALYLVSMPLLMRKVNGILPAQALKNRE